MPWYWSDDIAKTLVSLGKITESDSVDLVRKPVAYRVEVDTIAAAAECLLDEDEIPLAA